MSQLATRRASYQRLGHINIGQRSKPVLGMNVKHRNNVRQIEADLSKALNAASNSSADYHLSQAYRGLYRLLKDRNA